MVTALVIIIDVTLRRARLVQTFITIRGFTVLGCN